MLDMNNAKYARGGHGTEITIISELTAKFDEFKSTIKGSEYNTLINTIHANWEGADADRFVKLIEEVTTELQNKVSRISNDITNSILDDRTEFSTFQSKNANNIKKPNINM